MSGISLAARVVIADVDGVRFNAATAHLSAGIAVRHCMNLQELDEAISRKSPEVVVVGTLGDPTESLTAAHLIREKDSAVRVIFVADFSSEALVVDALRAGVAEYLKAPVTGLELAETITRFLPPDPDLDPYPDLVGASPAMRELKTMVGRIAGMNTTVLITGETGTGKEVVARLIHRLSTRAAKRLVCVNCAAIPDALLESELFGYEKGAFTGAANRHIGQFKLADGGTLFLDEIGDMSLPTQAKVLRALEQREVSPLGASKPIPVDMRTIAATNRDLEQLVEEGTFRSDLFFRLHVARLVLPSLRERPEDIPILSRYFLRKINEQNGCSIQDFTPSAMARLMGHHWPGNVRQLRNTIEAAALMCESRFVSDENLRMLRCFKSTTSVSMHMTQSRQLSMATKTEPEKLLEELEATNWNVTKTAQHLCWARTTIYRKMAKYKLKRTGEAESKADIESLATSAGASK